MRLSALHEHLVCVCVCVCVCVRAPTYACSDSSPYLSRPCQGGAAATVRGTSSEHSCASKSRHRTSLPRLQTAASPHCLQAPRTDCGMRRAPVRFCFALAWPLPQASALATCAGAPSVVCLSGCESGGSLTRRNLVATAVDAAELQPRAAPAPEAFYGSSKN